MSRIRIAAATLAAAFVFAPVVAHAEQAGTTTTTAEVKDDEDPVICKRRESDTGSRLGSSKICKTKSRWEAEESGARETMREIDRQGLVQPRTQDGG